MDTWSATVISVFLALVSLLAIPAHSPAETKIIIADATYTMGDGETPMYAEAMVLQQAKQRVLEQAGTYVESYTKVHNYNLSIEEFQSIAGGILQVEVMEKSRHLIGDAVKFRVKIRAVITLDGLDLSIKRLRDRTLPQEVGQIQNQFLGEIKPLSKVICRAPSPCR